MLFATSATVWADGAPSQCRGVDMLAELQARSPDTYKAVIEESRQTSNTEAVLWKIEKPDVAPSYLLGTMHLSDPRIARLSTQQQDLIAHSKSVALEVADLSEKAVGDAMLKAGHLLVYSDGRTLNTQLSSDEFKIVQRVVAHAGMPEAVSSVLKPWLITMLLATSDCERKQVASGAKVLDLQVAQEAQKNGLTVKGLETIEQQLESLASIANDQQIDMLKVGLKYADRSDDQMETIVQMYLKREIGAAMPFQLALAASSEFRLRRSKASRKHFSQTATSECATPPNLCFRTAAPSSPWARYILLDRQGLSRCCETAATPSRRWNEPDAAGTEPGREGLRSGSRVFQPREPLP